MYSASDIARTMARMATEDIYHLRNIELQWLMWNVWVDWYGIHGEPMFEDEFEVRKIGLVLPSVYKEFRIFACGPITCPKQPSKRLPVNVETFLYKELVRYRGKWSLEKTFELLDICTTLFGKGTVHWYKVIASEMFETEKR